MAKIIIDEPLRDKIKSYPYLSGPPHGGKSVHLWKKSNERYVQYRPICGRVLVLGHDSLLAVIIGRTACSQCLKIARNE